MAHYQNRAPERWTNRPLQNETGTAHHHRQHPAIPVCAPAPPPQLGPRLIPRTHLPPQWSDFALWWSPCQCPGRTRHLPPRLCPGWNTAFRQYRCGTQLYNNNQGNCTSTGTSVSIYITIKRSFSQRSELIPTASLFYNCVLSPCTRLKHMAK